MQAWIKDELASADLGDRRLDRRLALLLDQFSQKPSLSIPAACGSRKDWEAAYRFFDNGRVRPDGILAPHAEATAHRLGAYPVVLVAQDTSELDLTRPREQLGGPLGSERQLGFHVHPLLAMTPQQLPLGVVGAVTWARDPDDFHKRRQRRRKPIEDKESYRWLQGYRRCCELAQRCPGTTVVCLSDSGGDVYECFAAARPEPGRRKASWVVRAGQDRVLGRGGAKLWGRLARARVRGRLAVQVRARAGPPVPDGGKRRQARAARTAVVTVRAARVTLRPPQRGGGHKLPALRVNAILVREESPPAGVEAVEWLLLTDLPIATWGQVQEVIGYYCARWQVETYFAVLKGGCRVEDAQLERDERYLAYLAVKLIVAWRVLYLLMLGRERPATSCAVAFEEAEWRAAYWVVKGEEAARPPSLGEMIELVAQLGGHTGRGSATPPGPKVMWVGLQRLMDLAAAWRAFGPRPAPPSRPSPAKKKKPPG